MSSHFFLTGFMGTGKSTVGKILAQKLQRKFVDADSLVEEKMQMSVSDIFALLGEERFRQEETRVLLDLMQHKSELLVVALGGGIILKKLNREILKGTQDAVVINLKASVDVLVERLHNKEDRPLLKEGDPRTIIKELLAQRKSFYDEIPYQINTDKLSPTEVAEKILQLVC